MHEGHLRAPMNDSPHPPTLKRAGGVRCETPVCERRPDACYGLATFGCLDNRRATES